MAVKQQSGSKGRLAMGRLATYDTPLTAWTDLIQESIPIMELDVGQRPTTIQSESLVGSRQDSPDIIDRIGGGGPTRFEINPNTILHFLRGMLVPDASGIVKATLANKALLAVQTGNPSGVLSLGSPIAAPDYPSQVQLTLTGSATGDGTMVVKGFRRIGRPSSSRALGRLQPATETVKFTAGTGSNQTLTPKTSKFFVKTSEVEVLNVTGATSYKLDYLPDPHHRDKI